MVVKVIKRKKGKTHLQEWETYWFSVNGKHTMGITKQNGYFCFFNKFCKTLKEAKQHIIDELNKGTSILAL